MIQPSFNPDIKMKPIVIIPTYNEKENAEAISRAVLENLPEANVLFVDDNSPDGTGAICDKLAAAEPRIHVMHREKKQGLGRAYLAGFKWALDNGYDRIFEMDADFSHDPKELPEFIKSSMDADLVLGSRYTGGIRVMNWPLSRLLISTFAGVFVRLVTGMPVMDPTGGFKCFRREVLESIDFDKITSSGYAFQIEMTHNAWMQGYKIVEIPITFEDRRAGHSKMSKNIAIEAFFKVWKLYFSCGLRRKPARASVR